MSSLCGKLCSQILKERFGSHVQKVGEVLFTSGQLSLRSLLSLVDMPKKKVVKALRILIRYGLVSHDPGKVQTVIEYRLLSQNVLKILRFSWYLLRTKMLYGKESEIMIEDILRTGRTQFSSLVMRSYERLKADGDQSGAFDKSLVQNLRDQFEVLVNKQYIERLTVTGKTVDATMRFAPPRVELSSLINVVSSKQPDPNDTVFWSVNYSRFHQDLRDELLVTAIKRRISPQTGQILQLLLRQAYLHTPLNAPSSNPVLLSVLRDQMRKNKIEMKYFDEHMTVLAEDNCGFVSKDELSSNAAYIVNMQTAVEELAWTVLANAIEVRFGTAAARIFRLVRKEEYIEQEEIQKKAMLPDKECKLLTYTLVQGGWLQQQELRKSLQKAGPTKNFFLFTIDLGQVSRMYVETCYKAILNCIARREYVIQTHSALLTKQQRVDAIAIQLQLSGMDPDQIAEFQETITPSESTQLEGIHATINKLHQAELEIDSTLFILELYLESR